LQKVNCFAQIRTTKAFLPIFKQQAAERSYADSQIVNVVSMAGMLSAGGWGATPYEVSKNAAEAFTDGLRLEMKMFGVKVVSVNPSMHQTPLTDNDRVEKRSREEVWEPMAPSLKQEYGQGMYVGDASGRLCSDYDVCVLYSNQRNRV
jgi:NAD(P)-dependent dehydrogenase (short-subunit alcohol dehydrogenase family)